jgi:hypothetical protein
VWRPSHQRAAARRRHDQRGSVIATDSKEALVQLEKSQVVDVLRRMGRDDVADMAEERLPEQVDTSQLSQLLQEQGINPSEVIGKLRGGIPGMSSS